MTPGKSPSLAALAVCAMGMLGVVVPSAQHPAANIAASLVNSATSRVGGAGLPNAFPGTVTDQLGNHTQASIVGSTTVSASDLGQMTATSNEAASFNSHYEASASADQNSSAMAGTGTARLAPDPTGKSFFVDCTAAIGGNGSQASPWKSPAALHHVTLPAGATVNFRPGCAWADRVTVTAASSKEHPVLLRATPDVPGAQPVLSASPQSADSEYDAIMTVTSPNVAVEGLHYSQNHGVGLRLDGAQSKVVNSIIDNVGIGVAFGGEGGLASRVTVSNLHMVRATPGGDDDYGAVGFDVEAANVTVENSTCTNCVAQSPDFGTDGGFVEVWKKGDGLRVMKNTARNTNGFLEAGGEGAGDSAQNLLIQGNVIEGCVGAGLVFHTSGKYGLTVSNVRFDGNVISQPTNVFSLDPSGVVTATNNTVNGVQVALQ